MIKKLLVIGLACRVAVILWGILVDWLIPNYDTSFERYTFAKWDAVFFVRIAEKGFYEYEHFHAFFPGFPLLIRYIALMLEYFVPTIPFEEIVYISGLLISNLLFIGSIPVFYLLTKSIFMKLGTGKKLERFAYISTLFYIFNPATIFMSSVYTESTFSFFILLGLYFYQKSHHSLSTSFSLNFLAAIFFAYATSVRSNGILSAGFFLYNFLKYVLWNYNSKSIFSRCKLLCTQVACIVLVFLPYISFQYYSYLLYCTTKNENLITAENAVEYLQTNHPWCLSTIPHMYNYVQSKYWNVGLFKYYTWNQIPNFILAFPVLFISLSGTIQYMISNWELCLTLGLKKSRATISMTSFFLQNRDLLVYTFYWLFLAMYCIALVHIQVSTRFIFSSCHIIYWYMAHLYMKQSYQKFLIFYCVSYILIGSTLFVNFYPWT